MANSLKSRLFLNNLLLIFSVFVFLAAGLILIFSNNPASYRQTTMRLKLLENVLIEQISRESNISQVEINEMLFFESREAQARFLVVTSDHRILTDTGRDLSPSFNRARFNLEKAGADQVRLYPVRDDQNNRWLYTAARIDGERFLVTMIPRPILAVVNILRDEIFVALIRAILISLALAFGLSLATARWIARPLQDLVGGVRTLPEGEYKYLPLEGPGEVQELARAYNEMSVKVRENQQAQRDFIANVSHELKTPLTSIQGFAQSISEGAVQKPEQLRETGRIIFDEAMRMNKLVLDLLSLARLESGISGLKPAPLQLNELLKEVVERSRSMASSSGLEIDLVPGGEISMTADGDCLAQVFGNLIDNAIKFTPSGGKVTVKSSLSDRTVYVEVSDTGQGIPPADLDRIFERFYQVEKSRKGGIAHGSGLGLSIAEKIVKAHGGKIQVASTPGKGTKFTIELPVEMQIFDPERHLKN